MSDAPVVLDVNDLEAEWRELYPIACADFYRFLLGWAGEGGARDAYLERVTAEVLKALRSPAESALPAGDRS